MRGYFLSFRKAVSHRGHLAGAAGSPCGRVFEDIRVRSFSFLLRGISRRGARAGECLDCSCMFGFVSAVGDFSTNARNDNVFVWFIMSFWLNVAKPFLAVRFVYNVISTGVRVLTRTQRRNPPRKRYKVRVRHVRLPFREIAASRSALLATTAAVQVYFWIIRLITITTQRTLLATTRRYGCTFGLITSILRSGE